VRRRRDTADDLSEGTGAVATMFGFAAFLGFLLLATNLAMSLWARSIATAVAADEAQQLARSGGACAERADGATARVSHRVGAWWDRVSVDIACTPDDVTLHLEARTTHRLVAPGLGRLERTFVMRVEQER
jgi:hypothetical protein